MLLSGCEIIMEILLEQKIDTVFGYPGGQVLNVYDALYKYSDRIKHVLTAHEQGAVHAADGYSRASGRVGVCVATSGPGVTNLITGLATANSDSVPLVAITGNVPMELIGTDSFQEVATICLSIPVTKHSFLVKSIDDLAGTLREAFRVAKSGRPGPVLVDIPKNIQIDKTEYTPMPMVQKFQDTYPQKDILDKAVRLINKSHRPLIYCGGGVINANCHELIVKLAEKIDAYVAFSMMGLTAMDSASKRYLGMSGMHGNYAATKSFTEADVIIAAGVRFTDRATGNKVKFARNAKIIHLDIDCAEQSKNINTQINVCGSLGESLEYIIKNSHEKQNLSWHEIIGQFKTIKCNGIFTDKLAPEIVIRTINSFVSEDTCVVTDVGQHQMWTAQYYKFKRPRTFLTSGGLGTMGFGMGAAIGACMATKRRTVLFTSDGSFGMNLNEMATAVTQKLPIIIVLLNNNRLGMIRQWQSRFFDNRYMATITDRKTDFVKLAKAFGADGCMIENEDELILAVQRALQLEMPYLIECIIPSDADVLPMIPPNGSAENIILK